VKMAANGDAALTAAVASPTRSPQNIARDVYRHPKESLSFWGLKPAWRFWKSGPAGATGQKSWRHMRKPQAALIARPFRPHRNPFQQSSRKPRYRAQ
jgi:hypothetical protein